MNSDFQSIASRLPVILTTLLALPVALLAGSAIGHGEFVQVYLLLFGLAALGIVLALGSKFWLLIPIAFSFDLPAIPFGGRAFEFPEVAIALCTVMFAARYAMSSRRLTVFRPAHAGILLYTLWAGIVFKLHPVGLLVMGSSSGGARFYFKIALAFASFLIIANQKIGEHDAKWLVRLLVIGSITTMLIEIVRYKISPSSFVDAEEGFYTWHQALATPAMLIMLWLVSRYKLKELFGFVKPWATFLFILCVAVAAISGKRVGFASVLMFPLIAAALRKEYFCIVTGVVIGAIMIAVLTFGQGEIFRLPLPVQRSLSYLPGNWDPEIQGQFKSGLDPFRQELRELAWQKIEIHPFVGEGYAVNLNEAYGIRRAEGNINKFEIRLMALGSQWHNTWLGIWADFGFPQVIFWAIFWLQGIVIGYQTYRATPAASPSRTLTMMLLIYFIADVLRSWTSGHSALDPFSRWWMYGVLLAVAANFRRESREPETVASSSVRAPFRMATASGSVLRNR